MTSTPRTTAVALALSFTTWLVPLVGHHAVYLVGAVLLRPSDDVRRRLLEWLVLAVAQAAIVLAMMLLRRTGLAARVAAFAAVWVVCAVWLNAAMGVGIPVATMIEPENRPERVDLALECRAPGVGLHNQSLPSGMAAAGLALVAPHDGRHLALLQAPGCRLEPTAVPVNAAALSIREGGRSLHALLPPPGDLYHWHLTSDGVTRPLALDGWSMKAGHPRLLADGHTLGWVDPVLTSQGYAPDTPPWATLRLRDLDGGATRDIPLGGERGRYELLDGKGGEGPFVMSHQGVSRRLIEVDAAGHPGTALVPDHAAARDRVVLVASGWLAWDVYAENRRYVVEWNVAGGRGRVEIPRGSGITSAAVDAGGRYVAYSTTTNLSIGSTRDSVVVVRTTDGSEVYRRYFPRYHRSEVALLGTAPWFAVTGTTGSTPVVLVYHLP